MSLADKKTIVEFNNAVLSLTNILANGDWPEEIKFEKGKSPVEVHELVSGMFENDDETTLILDHLAPYVLEWEQVVKKRDASTIHKLPGNIGSVVNQLWVALDDDSKEGMWDELENICKCFQACRSWVSDQDKLAQIEQRLLKQSCQ